MTLANVGYAAFLAYLNEVLVEHFVGKPLEEKSPTSTAGGRSPSRWRAPGSSPDSWG